jgi:hypothetical protein
LLTQRLRVALFGDSTANAGRIHASTAVPIEAVLASGTDVVGISDSAVWSLPFHFPMAQLIGHFGIDGHNTAAMLDPNRFDAGRSMSIQTLIDAAPDLVVLRGGSINDLANVDASNVDATVENCVANHREILQRMVSGGRKVLDCGIFGYDESLWGSNYAGTPSVIRSALLQVNQALAAMAGDFGGNVRFVSPLGTLHDGSGRYVSGMTADGVHLSLAGGLALARLEAQVLTDWFGIGTGTAYPGSNLNTVSLPAPGTPGTPPGFASGGNDVTVTDPQVESVDGVSYFTVRCSVPAGASQATMQLPFSLAGLATNDVIGCEFELLCDVQSGSAPGYANIHARQTLVGAGHDIEHRAAYSQRPVPAATPISPLRGRVVFLPIRLPASGSSFNAGQTQLLLSLNFESSSSGVVRLGVGNPRLVRL